MNIKLMKELYYFEMLQLNPPSIGFTDSPMKSSGSDFLPFCHSLWILWEYQNLTKQMSDNIFREYSNMHYPLVPRRPQWINIRWARIYSVEWDRAISFNILRPRQNGRHLADDIFKCVFLVGIVWILIKISLRFVPKGHNILALVQIMAWRRPGDKPLFEPMMVSSLTHICVTRPQWINIQPAIAQPLYSITHQDNG